VRVAKDLVDKVDAEAEVRGLACGPMADRVMELGLQLLPHGPAAERVIELGLKALQAEQQRAAKRAAVRAATQAFPSQEALMAM
jgi:hypothetical protein